MRPDSRSLPTPTWWKLPRMGTTQKNRVRASEGKWHRAIHGIIDASRGADFRVVAALRQSDGEASGEGAMTVARSRVRFCWDPIFSPIARKKSPARESMQSNGLTAPARWPTATRVAGRTRQHRSRFGKCVARQLPAAGRTRSGDSA